MNLPRNSREDKTDSSDETGLEFPPKNGSAKTSFEDRIGSLNVITTGEINQTQISEQGSTFEDVIDYIADKILGRRYK